MSSLLNYQSDLVFTVIGGSRHGETLPIKTQKCLLSFDQDDDRSLARCAVLRGTAGVTIRNLDNQIVINGERKSFHWLQVGDQIEFPNSITLEVSHLGIVSNEIATDTIAAHEIQEPLENFSNVEQANGDLSVSLSTPAATPESCFEPTSSDLLLIPPTAENSPSAESLAEPPLALASVENRVDAIEKRLEQLSEQVASLVTLASCGKFSSTGIAESEWERQFAGLNASTSEINELPVETELDANEARIAELPASEPLVLSRRFDPLCQTATVEDPLIAPSETLNESHQVSDDSGNSLPSAPETSSSGTLDLAKKFSTLSSEQGSKPALENQPQPLTQATTKTAGEWNENEALESILKRLYENQEDLSLEKSETIESPECHFEPESLFADPKLVNFELSCDASATETPSEHSSYSTTNSGYDLFNSAAPIAGVDWSIDSTTGYLPETETGGETGSGPFEFESKTSPPEGSLEQTPSTNSFFEQIAQKYGIEITDASVSPFDSDQPSTTSQLNPQGLLREEKVDEEPNVASRLTSPLDALASSIPITAPTTTSCESVEDYMTQLLARMQIQFDGSENTSALSASQGGEASQVSTRSQDGINDEPGLMTAEEYLPKQKATKFESLETMREIANTSARTAVAFSDLDRRRTRGLMQIAISIGAIIMAAYYLIFVTIKLGDTATMIGLICLVMAAGTSFQSYKTFRNAKSFADLNPFIRSQSKSK